ncbi:hypothetical protein F0U62_45015 [Cystobacter fuscus]|nr:hypothetical protein F0U62_45015 [Cystobacter fuscus]
METASAPCPRHPTAAASFTCTRCGSFACEACRLSRVPSWCTDCEARLATWRSAPSTLRSPTPSSSATSRTLGTALAPRSEARCARGPCARRP